MKKKILFVIDSLGCGGAEKSLVSLLPLLNKHKYEIHLWILARGGVLESLVPSDVVIENDPKYDKYEMISHKISKIFFSVYYRFQKRFGKNAYPSEVIWKCCGRTTKGLDEEYDVAIAYGQGLSTYTTIDTIKAKKYIGWVNADMFATGYDIPFNLHFYDMMTYIVPVSEKLEKIMQINLPQYNNKYKCVYDILNPVLIQNMAKESVVDFSNGDKCLKLLTVARFVPPKGHELVIQAALELRQKAVKFVWILVGDGICLPEIKKKVNDAGLQSSIVFVGMKSNPYPYMKWCDIYVQTSIHEGFGITISEAKILNKPIVSTDFDTVYDQLENEVNGLIVSKDGREIAEGIQRIINNKELRQKFVDKLKRDENTKYLTEVVKVERLLDEKNL